MQRAEGLAAPRGKGVAIVICAPLLLLAAAPTPAGAATVGVAGSKVVHSAAAGEANDVVLSYDATPGSEAVIISDTAPLVAGSGCTGAGPVRCAGVAGVNLTAVEVNLGNMNDGASVDVIGLDALPASIETDQRGGDGADKLIGGPGADNLLGGSGNDAISGLGGIDTADYSDHLTPGGVVVTIDGIASDGNASDGAPENRDNVALDVENIDGSPENDTLVGDADANQLRGLAGDDTLAGNDGIGADGADTLSGGSHVNGDTASYATRTALIDVTIDDLPDDGGGGEDDNVRTDIENVTGGTGINRLTGDADANMLIGGSNFDLLTGKGGPDVLSGGGGPNDIASYAGHNADVTVTIGDGANDGDVGGIDGSGDDVMADIENLRGGSGDDRLTGNAVANELEGFAGDDVLRGASGNDRLTGGIDGDKVIGGLDTDLADYSQCDNAGRIAVDIGAGGANDGGVEDGPRRARDNVHSSVENLLGGCGNDTLIGDRDSNELDGYVGDDTLIGLGGPDHFDDDTGDHDTVSYAGHRAGVVATIGDGANDGDFGGIDGAGDEISDDIENLTGSSHRDRLTGGDEDAVLRGAGGNDRLIGGEGVDVLLGLGGIDRLFAIDGVADKRIDCGKGNNRRERAAIDTTPPADPKPRSC